MGLPEPVQWEVHPVPIHVDQLAGHGVGPGVKRLAHGLVAAAERRPPSARPTAIAGRAHGGLHRRRL